MLMILEIQDSENPQQVYVDTQTGALSYLTSLSTPPNTFLPGAIVTDFLHLGQGTVVSVPIPGAPANFNNPGPGMSLPFPFPYSNLLPIIFTKICCFETGMNAG